MAAISVRCMITDTAYENARQIGDNLSYYGFNLDFAPVADVWSNPGNTVIGKRAYSNIYSEAAGLIPYAVRGFHAGGVLCTLKHFPGMAIQKKIPIMEMHMYMRRKTILKTMNFSRFGQELMQELTL